MAQTKLNQIKKQRRQKIKDIQSLNLDPYPQPDLSCRQSAAEAKKRLSKSALVAGRLMAIRGHGKIIFADLADQTGKIQLFFQQKNLSQTQQQLMSLLDMGDIVSASGQVIKTKAGEVTVDVSDFQILSKSIRPLPEKWHGLKDVEERYRQRYVDLLINPQARQVFLTRTKILSEIRQFLDNHGFVEVETPILQPIYGGASAQPFITHHNTLDADLYLRISDELYLKRLIVGGFDKVYEVSRDFRNEGVSRFHNPEFTQIEFYWAYVDYNVLMDFTEKLLEHIFKSLGLNHKIEFQGQTLDFTFPLPRIPFAKLIKDHVGVNIDTIKTVADFKKLVKVKVDLKGAVGLGAHFDALYKQYVRPNIIQPTFVIDYPASMIALAKRKADNPDQISSFQLLAAGTEILKAYNELNDPRDQKQRWLAEEKLAAQGSKDAMVIDQDYIRALEYAMPPTAGWGMGIDRLTQFLTNQPTIKDVILFPTLRPQSSSK